MQRLRSGSFSLSIMAAAFRSGLGTGPARLPRCISLLLRPVVQPLPLPRHASQRPLLAAHVSMRIDNGTTADVVAAAPAESKPGFPWHPILRATLTAAALGTMPAFGLVPLRDAVFAVAFSAYLLAVHRFRFNQAPSESATLQPLIPWQGVRTYALFAAALAIALPAIYVAVEAGLHHREAAAEAAAQAAAAPGEFVSRTLDVIMSLTKPGSGEAVWWVESWELPTDGLRHVQAALLMAPHFFLTLAQVGMERLMFDLRAAPFVSLLVALGFNAYRLLPLSEWVAGAWKLGAAHVALAHANAAFWTFNLLGFLILYALPHYLTDAGRQRAPAGGAPAVAVAADDAPTNGAESPAASNAVFVKGGKPYNKEDFVMDD